MKSVTREDVESAPDDGRGILAVTRRKRNGSRMQVDRVHMPSLSSFNCFLRSARTRDDGRSKDRLPNKSADSFQIPG